MLHTKNAHSFLLNILVFFDLLCLCKVSLRQWSINRSFLQPSQQSQGKGLLAYFWQTIYITDAVSITCTVFEQDTSMHYEMLNFKH